MQPRVALKINFPWIIVTLHLPFPEYPEGSISSELDSFESSFLGFLAFSEKSRVETNFGGVRTVSLYLHR